MTQQELVDRSLIDPSSMVAIIDELEELGFAERRPHPSDRRKHAIHLTADGKRDPRARAGRRRSRPRRRSSRRSTADEVETLRRLLRKLAGVGA